MENKTMLQRVLEKREIEHFEEITLEMAREINRINRELEEDENRAEESDNWPWGDEEE